MTSADAKRPRFEQEESTASNGSQGQDGAESLPSSTESRDRRFDSLGSAGQCSTGGMPSPASIISGPSTYRSGISSMGVLGNASPLSSSSPSTPSIPTEALTGPLLRRANVAWPIKDDSSERRASIEAGQQQNRIDAAWLGSLNDPRVTRYRSDPLEGSPRSNRNVSFLRQQNSDVSSRSSVTSSMSNTSTSPSSIIPPFVADKRDKAAVSLPPLSAVTAPSTEHSFPTSSDHRYPDPFADRTSHPSHAQQSSQSTFSLASSAGRKFESLQLPLPHNISFGQRPLARPEHEEKLANIFDLQDIPRHRSSPRILSPDKEDSGSLLAAAAASSRSHSPPRPQHPPHKPALPALPPILRDDPHENILEPNADPLSVLAYAGRLVGRENNRRNSRQDDNQKDSLMGS